jgi:hypothetical protein
MVRPYQTSRKTEDKCLIFSLGLKMDGGDTCEQEGQQMPDSDRKQNLFIVGALIGGAVTYILSGNNVFWTVIGALVTGYVASRL